MQVSKVLKVKIFKACIIQTIFYQLTVSKEMAVSGGERRGTFEKFFIINSVAEPFCSCCDKEKIKKS